MDLKESKFTKISFFFLLVAFSFSIFPGIFVSFIIGAILLFFLYILIYGNPKKIKIYHTDFLLLSFFLFVIIRSFFLMDFLTSFLSSFAILFYIFVLVFFRVFPFDAIKIRSIVKFTSISLILFCSFALIHYLLIKRSITVSLFGLKICEVLPTMDGKENSPLQSILAHPTGGGVLVALFSSFILIWILNYWGKEKKNFKVLILCSIFISYTTIAFTSSRSGLLAIFISIIASIVFSKKYKLFFIFLFFGILFFSIPNEKVKKTISKPFYSQNIEPRLLQYKVGIEFFKENPLFGIGLMQFKDRYKNLRRNYMELPHYFFENVDYLHNTYLALLAETGIIGFLLFYAFLVLKLIRNIRNYLKKKDDFAICFSLFVILWFLLDSVFNAHLYVVPIGIFLLIGIGLAENEILRSGLPEKI